MDPKSSRSGTSVPDILSLAHAVREARRSHRLTQAQLAGLSGTGLRFIGELERAKPTVELGKVVAVLATLGLRLQVAEPDRG
jgi:HTH-type transcriptional regulator / antitoxin HipB